MQYSLKDLKCRLRKNLNLLYKFYSGHRNSTNLYYTIKYTVKYKKLQTQRQIKTSKKYVEEKHSDKVPIIATRVYISNFFCDVRS